MYEDCVLQSMRFPQKLWKIVNECKSGAIQWGPNGDTILLDYKRFQTEYLDARRPIFKTTNITSFIRQLNLYGFRKVTYTHTRDPIYGLHNPHVHEFLHDSFRADRTDLLSKVCRKASTSKGKCFQHDATKGAEDNPGSEPNCISRLKMCQLALTKTLEQITQEYRRKREEKLTVVKNSKRINSQDTVTGLRKAEFDDVSNWSSAVASSMKYPIFPPSTDTSFERETVSSWRIVTMDK
ncbi:heat shock transcription factor, X-linked-like [Odontomachus brunneus]|uniref:heat shock transcription factor, X-linked-like n=1 Tax=Odontomachus brunneus TaxID=486640 RepID=UPI0013F1E915|nr:heat shock transcription factor, X-linked-like [Odontomachus brunneus]